MEYIIKCPTCGRKTKRITYSSEFCLEEEHIQCEHCGYIYEMVYSKPVEGHVLDTKRGYKLPNGRYVGKNVRKRKRIRRKYGIKLTKESFYLSFI